MSTARSITIDEYREVVDLYAAGHDAAEIAELTGLAKGHVTRLLTHGAPAYLRRHHPHEAACVDAARASASEDGPGLVEAQSRMDDTLRGVPRSVLELLEAL